jgi:serine/threonine-protein kinase
MLERIGNCRILEEVASGGMAVVYRAIQDGLNRTVAIKALKTSVALDDQLVKRFEREAQSLAALQHENIIHVHDFHEEDGNLFIVMEYVAGIDLYDLLDHAGRVPDDVAAIIGMQVARALDYIHYRGIVHRDIKPANIMISRQGGVKLMDFGIARDRTYEDDLTQTGTGIGTPSYMSPEQILGDKLDSRSDIFSLGIVLFQMVTGRKPFVEDEDHSVMHKIRIERHPKVRKLNPDVPRELERIIDKCLEKEPRRRWRSAQALTMALERFLSRHVEMNYHSRLVLLLRNQDIITKLEADEYLNPAHTGASPFAATNIAARHVIRRSLWGQAIVLAVTMFVVGLIHLAPIGGAVPPAVVHTEPDRAFVRVVVNPWGRVLIDGKEVAVTPRDAPIEVSAGAHRLTVVHPFFEPHHRDIDLAESSAEEPQEILFDFDRSGIRLDEDTVIEDQGEAASP